MEYFPPNEDVILQDESPTDLYVVVAGAMVRTTHIIVIVILAYFYLKEHITFKHVHYFWLLTCIPCRI